MHKLVSCLKITILKKINFGCWHIVILDLLQGNTNNFIISNKILCHISIGKGLLCSIWICKKIRKKKYFYLKYTNGKGQNYNGSKQSWARTKNCTYFLYPIYFLITPIVHCVPGSWTNYNISRTIVPYLYKLYYNTLPLWQYRLWSFLERDTKLERFLAKNDCSQIKLLNF